MVWPATKELFPTWVNKNLSIGEKGSDIDADVLNEVYDLLERLQDSLGVSFISGFADLKARLASMDIAIGDAGDFKADGSVPMTGEMDLGNQDIKNIKQVVSNLDVQGFITPADDYPLGNTTKRFADVYSKNFYHGQGLKGGAYNLSLYTDSQLRLRIDQSTGYIGVNWDSPTERVEVRGGNIKINDNGAGLILRTPDGTKLYKITVDNSGNVVSTLVV